MKGQIPRTERLILESKEHQWQILVNGLIKELETSALIEKSPGNTVRIKLVIKEIIPPEQSKKKIECEVFTNFENKIANGLARSSEFINNLLEKTSWIFIGYIAGEEKTPIIITYYKLINIFIYTQKLSEEKTENFLPFARNYIPSKN